MIDSLNIGGAEKSLISLLSHLPSDKYDITLYRTNPYGELDSKVPKNIIKRTLRLTSDKATVRVKLHLGKCLYSISQKYFDNKRHPAETWWNYIGRHLDPLTEKFDIAIAYHQGFPTYFVSEKVNAAKKFAWINADITKVGYTIDFNRRFYNKYNHIITVSNSLRNTFITEYSYAEKKVSTIFDIINRDVILAKAGNSSPYNDDDNIIKILTVGRLVKLKGYDLAIDTAKLLMDTGIKFHWYFLGEGLYRNNIEYRITKLGLQNHITLLGRKENPYPYFKFCDLYVQPSYNEGYGIALYEAKIFSRPIVSTDFPSARDIISDNISGIICHMDSIAIFNSIIKLQDSNVRQYLSNNTQLTGQHDLYDDSTAKIEALLDD